MQIQLKQADIEKAIGIYVRAEGLSRDVAEVKFTMGRRGSGLTADVTLGDSLPDKITTGAVSSNSAVLTNADDGDSAKQEAPPETTNAEAAAATPAKTAGKGKGKANGKGKPEATDKQVATDKAIADAATTAGATDSIDGDGAEPHVSTDAAVDQEPAKPTSSLFG